MHIEAIAIGCVTGFISAFFGIGGSSIDTPLLRTFLHLPPYLALGTPLPTALITVFMALIIYREKNLIDYRIFRWSVIGGVPSIILGSYFSQFFSGRSLMLFTALVLFFVGLDFIFRIFKNKTESKPDKNHASPRHILLISSLSSIISGILAIGGGLFIIPSYVLFLRMKIKKAIATSLLTISVMIIPACLVHYRLGHIDLGLSAMMSIGVIPMAYIGAKADLKTKSGTIQLLFGIMLVIFSAYFFISQMKAF
jgi:uncharacterized membrane protein YfcA